MKLLMLTTTFSRFKEDWVLPSLDVAAKELAKTNKVRIITSGSTNTLDYEKRDGFEIYRFNYFIKRFQDLTYTGGMLTVYQRSKLSRLKIPLFFLSYFFKTLKYGRDCDVIHAYWTPSVIIALPLRIFYKKPIVVSPLGGDIRGIPKWFNKIAFRFSDAIIAPVNQDYVTELGYKDKLSLLGCCYDYDKFDKKDDISGFKKEFNLKDEKIVTFLGRMDPFKDPITFVKSIPYVLKKIKNVKFFIVGYGFLLDDVKNLVRKLKLDEYIIITGPRKDTNIILEASDIFVNLSPEDNFFSVAIQEAMAKRVSCLLTNAGNTEKTFTHIKNCYLVNPKNPGETADAIITLLKDEKLRKNLGENSIKLLEEKGFTKEAVIGGLNFLYKKLNKNN